MNLCMGEILWVSFCEPKNNHLDQVERFVVVVVFKSKNVKIHEAIIQATMEKLKFPRTIKRI